MSAIKATWIKGQIVLDSPGEWPDGCRLLVSENNADSLSFMTEEDQDDDPDSIQRWIDELRALPALPMDSTDEAELIAWRKIVKGFNVDAVRRQMDGDTT